MVAKAYGLGRTPFAYGLGRPGALFGGGEVMMVLFAVRVRRVLLSILQSRISADSLREHVGNRVATVRSQLARLRREAAARGCDSVV